MIVEKTIGNRVSAKAEIEGLDIPEMGVAGYVNEDTRRRPDRRPGAHLDLRPRRPRQDEAVRPRRPRRPDLSRRLAPCPAGRPTGRRGPHTTKAARPEPRAGRFSRPARTVRSRRPTVSMHVAPRPAGHLTAGRVL